MDLATARLAGSSCIYAYDFDGASKPVGVTSEQSFSGGPKKISNAVCLGFADRNILAFQGTITQFEDVPPSEALHSVMDWIDNFKVKAVSTLGLPGLIHEGFSTQFSYISADVFSFLKGMKPADKKKPLVVTGHSQGGAIATIATKYLELAGIAVEETFTFAAPRCGNGEFVDSIVTPLNRIEFGCDIVPHVPLSISLSSRLRPALELIPTSKRGGDLLHKLLTHASVAPGYASAGTLYYSRDYNAPIKKYASDERVYFERFTRLPFNLKRLIEDHHMVHYMDTLN